jgi:hypothetical protein
VRITELLEPQKPRRKKSSTDTVPEVFIIESLTLTDEAKDRREGEVLAAVLKMCGKKPLYYYIRTRAELEHLAAEFEASGYRYLHLSCHGGDTSLATTLDSINYKNVAKILANRLGGRRLFVSACSAGNEMFAELVGAQNKAVISIAAPAEDIRFDHAVAFWSALYVKLFSINAKSMHSGRVVEVMRALAELFNVPMHWSRRGERKEWTHELIDG